VRNPDRSRTTKKTSKTACDMNQKEGCRASRRDRGKLSCREGKNLMTGNWPRARGTHPEISCKKKPTDLAEDTERRGASNERMSGRIRRRIQT